MTKRFIGDCADPADLFGLRNDLPPDFREIIRYMEHRLSVRSKMDRLLFDLYRAIRQWALLASDDELMQPGTLAKILEQFHHPIDANPIPAQGLLKLWNVCVLQKKDILSMGYGSAEWRFLAHIVGYFSHRKRWLRSWTLLNEKAVLLGLNLPYLVQYRPSTGTFLLHKQEGPGRPRDGDLKSKILKVRLDEETMQHLQEYCKENQLTLVDAARTAVLALLSGQSPKTIA